MKEWIKETNRQLTDRGSVYRVRNNIIYYFMAFYFWITLLMIVGIFSILFYFFGDYLFWISNNSGLLINRTQEFLK